MRKLITDDSIQCLDFFSQILCLNVCARVVTDCSAKPGKCILVRRREAGVQSSEGASRGGQSGGREAGGKVVRTNLGKQKSASF